MKNLGAAKWVEHPDNPLIRPEPPNWLLGDPTLLTPDRTPDGKWRLFCNSVRWVYQYVSDDGVQWVRQDRPVCRGMRAFVYREDDLYYLFCELHNATYTRSRIVARTSRDLLNWSDPTQLLVPQFAWDGVFPRYVGNPCLIKVGDRYRLYYSSGFIVLADTVVTEPKYIGVAQSEAILGPYRRHPVPLIGPHPDHPWRNRGAGSIKVYPRRGGGFWAFNNGIYRGADGRHGSAIMLLESADGYRFHEVRDEPIVKPSAGWTRAFAYAFDMTEYAGEVRLYFNARDGWAKGKEHIGFVRAARTREEE